MIFNNYTISIEYQLGVLALIKFTNSSGVSYYAQYDKSKGVFLGELPAGADQTSSLDHVKTLLSS